MKLVIIEGIGKKETVEKYLGKGYKVFATKGHIRDLPTKTLAVNVKNNYEPKYEIIPDKKDTVKSMIDAAAKADGVLLATDPDREGEAISWHVANILNIPVTDKVRIEFNEISKKAIQNALEHPRAIDVNLVDAQQARRVLDRLVGYKLSPVLCKKIQGKLSAGRVQSVTLRLIVEREREIRAFKPEEYWNFASILKSGNEKIKANLALRNKKKFRPSSAAEVEEVIADLDGRTYTVSSVKRSVTKSKPPAPFITSTMQQDALNKLGMSLSQTTLAAQNLYEGVDIPGEGKVALITYIRTDSTRVSADAMNEAKAFIEANFGGDYVPARPNVYASKKNAQDAHEAIRPITLSRTPDSLKDVLSKNNYRLYKLVYERFLASQMSEATYNSLTVDITCDKYGFKVNGKTPLFKGYTAVYSDYVESKDETVEDRLPDLKEGEILRFVEYKYEQKFTKPPQRYTEASIVKTMEEKGIGRPATYTPTVTLLLNREYTEKDGKFIKATELGEKVTDMLVKYFPEIMDVTFTAGMESKLDEIEEGGKVWQQVVDEFYDGFEDKIAMALGDSFSLKAQPVVSDVICDKCGATMLIKSGRYGKFLACPNYPRCKNTVALDKDERPIEQTERASDVVCELCGKTMIVKQGKFGPFLACPGYPKCKNIKNLEKDESLGSCPICGKPMKRLGRGKSVFYGCSGYPDCKFASTYKITQDKCPNCGGYTVEKTYKDGVYHCCASKECGYKAKVDSQAEAKL